MGTSLQALHDARNIPQWSRQLATLARQALIAEAELTPKPGLVDRRGSGSHDDLSLDLMRQSAIALEPFFAAMGAASTGRPADRNLRAELAEIGRDAERAMYRATRRANSHKGAIWTLGLLVAAAARKSDQSSREIAEGARAIARFSDRASLELVTHGEIARRRYGAGGARGEAWRGFPHVVRFGLPVLRKRRDPGHREDVCYLDALFSIMSELDDTCVLYRGGIAASRMTKAGARAVIGVGGYGSAQGRIEAHNLDHELNARRLSPGGSADLLAATIFLDAVERRQHEVSKDQSGWEEMDGKA
jgi:triphosphoribosyl-dephospho-CoA synthase